MCWRIVGRDCCDVLAKKNKNVMGRNHKDMGKKRKSKQGHRCQPSCSLHGQSIF